MSPSAAIQLEGVGKRYWKLEEQAMLLKSLIPFARQKRSELWALRDMSLTIEQGETVGVVGRNGAGKTTLLRMLAGVTRPSEGRVSIAGRIAPLISVGVGFHQEMSGRENVFVNGMLLGLTRQEIESRFDAIVAFAELEEFIDTPVKFYSSGMFMRLGFSVAVHTDPAVLLVDEVLAVGDIAFQLKCFDRMREIQARGTTIVLVSHGMQAIRMLCPRALVIRNGELDFDGPSEEAIARHHELLMAEEAEEPADADPHRWTVVGGAEIIDVSLLGPEGPVHFVTPGESVVFRVRLRFKEATESPLLNFAILSQDGTVVYGAHSPIDVPYRHYAAGAEGEFALRFTPRLGGGTYRMTWAISSSDGRRVTAIDSTGMPFYVDARPGSYGVADLEGVVLADDQEMVERRPFRLEGNENPVRPPSAPLGSTSVDETGGTKAPEVG